MGFMLQHVVQQCGIVQKQHPCMMTHQMASAAAAAAAVIPMSLSRVSRHRMRGVPLVQYE
jgi:hypothetical protein